MIVIPKLCKMNEWNKEKTPFGFSAVFLPRLFDLIEDPRDGFADISNNFLLNNNYSEFAQEQQRRTVLKDKNQFEIVHCMAADCLSSNLLTARFPCLLIPESLCAVAAQFAK